MKIAMVQSTPLPIEEGIGNYTTHLASGLQEMGHEVVHFTRRTHGTTAVEALADAPVHRAWFRPIYPIHVHLHRPALQRALDREGPFDVVHLHSPHPPMIRHANVVSTFHTPLAADAASIPREEPGHLRNRLQLPVSKAIEQRILDGSKHVTTVSESNRNDLLRLYDVPRDKVTVVPNGAPLSEIPPTMDGRDPDRILFVARVAPRKGIREVLEAVRLLTTRGQDIHLDLVGRGPLVSWVQKTVAAQGLQDHVHLPGFIPRERLLGLLASDGIFVHAPRYEGMPTNVLEAMAAAMPIVVSDAPGTRDLITDGENGRVVPIGDAEALADAIQCLRDDPAEARRLGQAARRTAEQDHAWSAIVKRFEQIYRSAIS